MKKALFIDRDGTLIVEPPITEQVNSLEELTFLKGVVVNMHRIAQLDYELVLVTNQDGLGSPAYPEAVFRQVQQKMIETLENEGIHFSAVHIDRTHAAANMPTRKPNTGMLTNYMTGQYDLPNCYVIGDRLTDIELAKNLGAKGILIQSKVAGTERVRAANLQDYCALVTDNWQEIYAHLRMTERTVTRSRNTRETQIDLTLDLDDTGESNINTGLNFFDHMLSQIPHHSGVSLSIAATGDLHVDEHHTVEDVGILLGEAIRQALGDKRGIERYGFCLPMDDCDTLVTLDFGGRIDFAWRADFTRECIGDMPTELFEHFFKSLCHSAQCNLHIEARGQNEHHKIEGIFKAFARSLKMAIARNPFTYTLPSSKGIL